MKRNYVTVNVDVDVDVYLDDIDTDDLIEELESRGIKAIKSQSKIKTSDQVIDHLKQMLGLRPWASKAQLIKEIEEL